MIVLNSFMTQHLQRIGFGLTEAPASARITVAGQWKHCEQMVALASTSRDRRQGVGVAGKATLQLGI